MADERGQRQRTIFDDTEDEHLAACSAIRGLQYVPKFVTADQHDQLLRNIDANEWRTDLRRRVQHYGYRYDYKSRSVDYSMRLGVLPPWAASVADNLLEQGYFPDLPDQVIVNEYEPGQGISNHIDCEPCFTETIASLSLGSTCIMNFTNKDSGAVIPVLLEPGSLVVLKGESRYGWMHGIPTRKSDVVSGRNLKRSRRVSLTFRKVILQEPI